MTTELSAQKPAPTFSEATSRYGTPSARNLVEDDTKPNQFASPMGKIGTSDTP